MKPINSNLPKRCLLMIWRGVLLFLPTFLFTQVPYPPLPDSADWISASLNPDANYWEIKEAALDYFAEYPDHPDFKNFGRWSHFWESRVGDTNNPGSFQSALDGWSNLAVNCFGEPEYEDCQEDQFNANWQSLGPNSIDQVVAIGRIQSINPIKLRPKRAQNQF